MANLKLKKSNYDSPKYKKKMVDLLRELEMEEEQIEYFLMLPLPDKELYELALEIEKDVLAKQEHMKLCKGCAYCIITDEELDEAEISPVSDIEEYKTI